MRQKGVFITFEGTEGGGKSTQIAFARDFLERAGWECVVSREPGGTEISEKIRELLLTSKSGEKMSPKAEMLLFEAARAQHVDELIRPALAAGKCVICDRFTDSTSAYQGAARLLGSDMVDSANAIAVGGCSPDITFLLDLDAAEGLRRARMRDGGVADRMGSQKIDFYNKVRASYLELAKKNPERIFVIDASKSAEEVSRRIADILEAKLK